MVMQVNVATVEDFLYKMGEETTRAIVVDYIKYRLDSCGYAWDNDGRESNVTPNPVESAMRRLGDDFENRFRHKFVDMIQKLNVTQDNAYETFCAIMDEIFNDGVNWGRIVALFGFSGRFAVHCFEHNMPDMVDTIIELVTSYVDTTLLEWMKTHNYWQGFLEFQSHHSEKVDQWPQFKKFVSFAVAGIGFLTLGALLTQK